MYESLGLKRKKEDLVNFFDKTEQLKDHGYSKILRLRNSTDLDELRDKAADRTEWQCLVVPGRELHFESYSIFLL